MKLYIRNVWVIKFLSICIDLILSLWSETHSSVKNSNFMVVYPTSLAAFFFPICLGSGSSLFSLSICGSQKKLQARAYHRRDTEQAHCPSSINLDKPFAQHIIFNRTQRNKHGVKRKTSRNLCTFARNPRSSWRAHCIYQWWLCIYRPMPVSKWQRSLLRFELS